MSEVPKLSAIIILDGQGQRISAKYFPHWVQDESNVDEFKTTFEATLWKKTKNTNARNESEIITNQGQLCCFRSGSDVKVYIIGPSTESELVLAFVLDGFFDALTGILHGATDRRTILDNLEMVMLLVDELCDGGYILEADSVSLMSRVLMREVDVPGGGGGGCRGRVVVVVGGCRILAI